jgi:beta-galactosidase
LKYGKEKNVIAVKVDNSQQPNSRWYSGSGIYRHVWLVTTNNVFVDHWGTCITTPEVNEQSAKVNIQTSIRNASSNDQQVTLKISILDKADKQIAVVES